MGIEISFDAKKVVKELERKQEEAEKAVARTISDMKSRAPGWVATEVVKSYNIKRGRITPSSTGKPKKTVAALKVTGKTLESLAFEYRGRLLSPAEFGMEPRVAPVGRNYTVSMKVKTAEGKKLIGRHSVKRILGSPYSAKSHNFLADNGHGTQIPFQRMSQRRTDLHAFKTLSVPQMITNDEVRGDIERALAEGLSKRLDYHMSRIK